MENEKALVIRNEKALKIRDYINSDLVTKQLAACLPKFMDMERFLRTFFTALMQNDKLLDCTKKSMLAAMIQSAQLGLEPIMGKAALIPYKDECQFQPMYRGLIDLARRTGEIKITAHNVYENDNEFDIEYGDNEKCFHKPLLNGDRGEILGTYTVWTFPSGVQTFLYMTIEVINGIRDRTPAYQYAMSNKNNAKAQETPWITYPGEQNKKTVIKRHSKLQPCSIEMQRAIQLDDHAEIGKRQALLLNPFGKPGESEPGAEPDPEAKTFDELIEGKNTAYINDFLAEIAKDEKVEIEKVKEEATKDFGDFWEHFVAYQFEQKEARKARTKKEKEEKDKKGKEEGEGEEGQPNLANDPYVLQLITALGWTAAKAKIKIKNAEGREDLIMTLQKACDDEGIEYPKEDRTEVINGSGTDQPQGIVTVSPEKKTGDDKHKICPSGGRFVTADECAFCEDREIDGKKCPIHDAFLEESNTKLD